MTCHFKWFSSVFLTENNMGNVIDLVMWTSDLCSWPAFMCVSFSFFFFVSLHMIIVCGDSRSSVGYYRTPSVAAQSYCTKVECSYSQCLKMMITLAATWRLLSPEDMCLLSFWGFLWVWCLRIHPCHQADWECILQPSARSIWHHSLLLPFSLFMDFMPHLCIFTSPPYSLIRKSFSLLLRFSL